MPFYSNKVRAPARRRNLLIAIVIGILLLAAGIDLALKRARITEVFVKGTGRATVLTYKSQLSIERDGSVNIAETMIFDLLKEGSIERYVRQVPVSAGEQGGRLVYNVKRAQHAPPGEKTLRDIPHQLEGRGEWIGITLSRGEPFQRGQNVLFLEYGVANLVQSRALMNELTWNLTGTHVREPLHNFTALIIFPPILEGDTVGYTIERKSGYDHHAKYVRPVSEIIEAKLEERPSTLGPQRKDVTLVLRAKGPLLPYEGIAVGLTWPKQPGI